MLRMAGVIETMSANMKTSNERDQLEEEIDTTIQDKVNTVVEIESNEEMDVSKIKWIFEQNITYMRLKRII